MQPAERPPPLNVRLPVAPSDAPAAPRHATARCGNCKTKLGLVRFPCTCSSEFCSSCRLPEVHSCLAQVKKEVILPKVVAPKVETL
jgi:hypothetical protein